jgi:dipeptidase E
MAGLSAGAICWHDWGHSDSRSYSGNKDWSYIKVRSLGLVPVLFCPHLDGEKRHASFKAMVEKEWMIGIGCDNKAAVWYHDEGATCITAGGKARTHLYVPGRRGVAVESFKNNESFSIFK